MDEWLCLPRNRGRFQSYDCVNCHPGRDKEEGPRDGERGRPGGVLKNPLFSVGEELMVVVEAATEPVVVRVVCVRV